MSEVAEIITRRHEIKPEGFPPFSLFLPGISLPITSKEGQPRRRRQQWRRSGIFLTLILPLHSRRRKFRNRGRRKISSTRTISKPGELPRTELSTWFRLREFVPVTRYYYLYCGNKYHQLGKGEEKVIGFSSPFRRRRI